LKKIEHNCGSNCKHESKCIFKGLDSLEMSNVTANAVFNTYKKNQAIFLQGNTPYGLHCVHSGKVKIVMATSEGKESILRLVNASEILGHRALFSEGPYNASAVALEETVVAFYKKEFILALTNKHSSVALNLLSQLSSTTGETETKNATLVHKNARERLAGLLIQFIASYGVRETGATQFIRLHIKLTREEMACMIGTTIETLVRLMTEFKNERIIAEEGKVICILDEEKLIEFANV
jgi:CRP-like cAMP-binding protein